MHALPIEKLRSLTLEELERIHDKAAENTQLGLNFYRQEIEWRHQKMSSKTIEDLTIEMRDMTKSIKRMTLAVIGLTVISIVVAGYPLLKTWWG